MSTRNSLVRRAGMAAVVVLATGLAGTASRADAGLWAAGRAGIDDQPTVYASPAAERQSGGTVEVGTSALPWTQPNDPMTGAWPDLSDPATFLNLTDESPVLGDVDSGRPATAAANPTPVPLPPASYLAAVGMVVAWRAKRWVTRRR